MNVHIRPATVADTDWITALAPRLHEFGPAPWRDVAAMNASVATGFAQDLADPTPGAAFFAAVGDEGAPLGFITLHTTHDYFTQEPVAHIGDIVVARAGEGRGVGRALLTFAEQWAADGDYRLMSLNVFAGNDRARRIYEEAGYEVEWTRMVKRI